MIWLLCRSTSDKQKVFRRPPNYQGRLKAENPTRQHDVPDNKRIMCEADALFLLQAV
jgi:hypothetical protein